MRALAQRRSLPALQAGNVYPLKTIKFKWECPNCREGGAYLFSHLVGTIFENTNVDRRGWSRVIHLLLTTRRA